MRQRLFALSLAALVLSPLSVRAAESVRQIPPPALDDPLGQPGNATAVLAGGCYWGTQGLFEHVKGIQKVAAGYSGDFSNNSGEGSLITTLTPAESVEITYDPSKITYGKILQIYFSVIHDPTQKDRQGPDVGPQYRSDVFPNSDQQEKIAEAYIKQLGAAGAYPAPIVTRIDRFHRFVLAKPSEQDVMRNHSDMAYVVAYDTPKLAEMKRLFPAEYLEQGLTYSD